MNKNNDVVSIVEGLFSEATIMSTGSKPEEINDLLVIGHDPQDVAVNAVREAMLRLDEKSYICDDAVILPSRRTGVAYRNHHDFTDLVERIITGNETDPIVKPWSVGPWLPEAFAYDVYHARTITVGKLIIDAGAFSPYPTKMRDAIVDRTSLEIEIKSSLIDQSEGLGLEVLKSDIAFAGLRKIHAESLVFFRGIKYLDSTRRELDINSNSSIDSIVYDYFHNK